MSIETTIFQNKSGQALVYSYNPKVFGQHRYSLSVKGLGCVGFSFEENSSLTTLIKEMISLQNSSSDSHVLDEKRFCIINWLIENGGLCSLRVANIMKEAMIPCFNNQVDFRKDVEQNLETKRKLLQSGIESLQSQIKSFQSSGQSEQLVVAAVDKTRSLEAPDEERLELVNNISVFLNRQLSIVPSPLTDRPLVSKIDASFPFLGGAKKLQDAIVPADYFMKK